MADKKKKITPADLAKVTKATANYKEEAAKGKGVQAAPMYVGNKPTSEIATKKRNEAIQTKEWQRIDNITKEREEKRLAAMEEAKKKREERKDKKRIYGTEYELIQKVSSGKATDVDKISYNYYKRVRERETNNTLYYLNKNIDDFTKGYNSLVGKNFVSADEYDKYAKDAERIWRNAEQAREYYELYGSEDDIKQLTELRNTFVYAMNEASRNSKAMSQFKDENEYNAVKEVSSVTNYAQLRQKRGYLQRQKGKGNDADIQSKLDALNKYGFNANVIASMTTEDWEYEKERINSALSNAQGEHDRYNTTAYINAHYEDAVNKRGLSEEAARDELQDIIKNASDKVKYYSDLLNEVTELARMSEAEKAIENDWGIYRGHSTFETNSNAKSKRGTSGDADYDAINYGVIPEAIRSEHGTSVNDDAIKRAKKLSSMSKEEKEMYNFLYNTYGAEKAKQYLESMDTVINKRYTVSEQKKAFEQAQAHPVQATIYNVLTSPLRSAEGLINNVANVGTAITGGEIDPYADRFMNSNLSSVSYEGVKSNIDSKVGKFIYSAATQAAELALNMAISKGIGGLAGKTASSANANLIANKVANVANQVLLSSNSMLSTTLEYKKSGASDLAALGMGMISGAIEAWTERKSLSNLLKSPDIFNEAKAMAKLGKWSLKIGGDALKEGWEEIEANLYNTLAAFIFEQRNNDSFLAAYDEAIKNGYAENKAFWEAVKAVSPEYLESFAVGALSGGMFGTANTVSSVHTYNQVRDDAAEFFKDKGYTKSSVMEYLIKNGVSEDTEIARLSDAIVHKANGQPIDDTEIKESPFLSGVLMSYVEGVEVPANAETVSENQNSVTKAPENVIETAKSATEKTEISLSSVSESDPEQSRRSIGRNGSKAYLSAVTEGDGGLVDSLISEGYSVEEALSKTKQFFNYLYDQGRKGTDKDIAMQAASEYILGGHDADALLFYNSGKNDADGLLIGKTNARLVHNNTLRQMRKDGSINYRIERAINALASKLGIDIEFNSTMSDGKLGSFNAKTGRLMINSKAKNKFFITAVHESVHAMRSIDPESYNKLVDIVDSVLRNNDVIYDKAWNAVLASYKKQATKDGKINKDYIDEELTAKVVSHLLADEKFIKNLAKSDRGIVQRIYDAIVDLFQRIFKRYEANTTSAEKDVQAAIDELKSEFKTISTMFETALESTKGLQQDKMKLPRDGEKMHSNNFDNPLTVNSENDNINSSKGAEQNGENMDNNDRGTGGISENAGNKGRGNTGDKRESSSAETEMQGQKYYLQESRRGNGNKGGGKKRLASDSHNSMSASGGEGQEAKGRRFLKAVENGDSDTAVALLNEQAEKNGYVPSKAYHGTKAESAFTKFKAEKPIWITSDIRYASEYADLTYAEKSSLYAKSDSRVYELYAKHGKVLDIGDISREILTYDEVVEFAKKIGFSVSEVLECRAQGRMYEDDAIWSITHTPKFAELARQKGYDSLRALEHDGKVETYGILYPQNVKSSKLITYNDNGDIIPLSERFNPENEDIRYNLESGEEVVIETPIKRHKRESLAEIIAPSLQLREEILVKLDEHIKKYGTMKKGANAVRDVSIPKKTSDGNRNVRRFTRTAIESDTISDAEAVKLMEDIASGKVWTTYQIAGDKKTTDIAYKTLETRGFEKMLNEWDALLESGKKIDKQDIVNAQILAQEASKRGDEKTSCRLIAEIAAEFTDAGQIAQAASLMKKLGASANVYSIERAIDRAQRDIIKKYGAKAPKIQKPTELIEKYSEALERENKNGGTDRTESDKYADMIYENIGKQIPVTFMDKVDALRYFCMLANPKTHTKNILSNTVFWPLVFAKNILASSIEGGTATVMKLFGKDFQRTKSVRGMFSKGEIREYAKNDALKMQKVYEQGEGKYNEHMSRFDEHRLVFNKSFVSKGIEKMRGKEFDGILNMITRKNSDLLGIEDWWFGKSHYTRALMSYMVANKLTPETITAEQLDVARIYALKEAKRATFRDKSELAKRLRKFSRANPVMTFIVESQVPFKGTPINLLKRSFEYSPAGIITAMAKGLYKVRRGEFTASEFISELSEGLTGSGLFVAGYFLLFKDILHGVGDDEEENKLAELNGVQNYSLKLGGQTYTIDWAIPAASALFAGAEMAKLAKDDEVSFADMSETLGRLTHPLIETSMLDGLTNTLKSVTYGENAFEMVENFVASFVTNYLGQFTPSALGAMARVIDPVRRKTYVDKNSDWPQWFQIYYQQQAKKIPLLSKTLEPYVNAKGEAELNAEGNIFARLFQNTISPGYYKKIRASAVDEEVARLYDVLGEAADGILPKSVTKKIGEVNLSAEQYTTYQETTGKAYYKALKDIIASDYYARLADEQKVELLKKAREYSVEVGKDAALPEYKITNGWLKTAFEIDGGFQYILDLDAKESFSEKDLQGESFDKYESDRDTMFNNIISNYKPSDTDYEFADKYYVNLYEFTDKVALEKNSGGKYTIDTVWINNIKNMTAREQAEYIYGKTLVSKFDDQDDANAALKNDSFISDKVRMWLLQKSTGGNSSPGVMYNKYLAKYNVNQTMWGRAWELKEEYNDRAQVEKKFDSKKAMLLHINSLPISNEQKSAMYRALGYGDSAAALKNVPWYYVPEN